ncbi:MAG: peptidoglycan editing factor PgeF [Acidobacteria bacterium]|nr:peptidoglycan editing factor PgeF [Acidobacteriota bacterium]
MPDDGFILRYARGIPYYSCREFERVPGVRHAFSTRSGLPGAPGFADGGLLTLRQVHSSRVCVVREPPDAWEPPEGDALAAAFPGAALGVRTADCFPLLVADPVAGAVAAVHSGWRGTLGGVLADTLRALVREFGSRPGDLHVAVGPGIRACCFEVGPEVADRFSGAHPGAVRPAPGRPGKYLLDLPRVLDAQMDEAGVARARRYDSGLCTVCRPREFFSYRREGAAAGRMMSVIALG